ncbi:MAG: VOC family protein [Cyclobacteriaceae bacterium]
MSLRPFHLAIPVTDITKNRAFYGTTLGFEEGRSSDKWVDFNFYGHQLVIHVSENTKKSTFNPVDGQQVPVPHFGVVLEMEDWKALANRIKESDIQFIIEPYIRFEGEPGEQATMFFLDPSGNALEFKAFENLDSLFAK